jgi:TDG/mug DNA glycosylase family protein
VLYENGIYRKYGLPPLIEENSKILILGSFPSIQSLEKREYYANPANQFWRILCSALDEPVPSDYSGKSAWLEMHQIALWDSIGSCLRQGSSDSKIMYPLANDLSALLTTHSGLTHLLFNGNNPLIFFSKLGLKEGRLTSVPPLPSTSSLYTRLTLPEKIERWKVIKFIPGFRKLESRF